MYVLGNNRIISEILDMTFMIIFDKLSLISNFTIFVMNILFLYILNL